MSRTRAKESGAYLGGIGTMLGETRVCSRCGGVHESQPYGLRHRGLGECPAVVSDSFAIISLADPEEIEQRPEEFALAAQVTPLPVPLGGVMVPTREVAAPRSRPLEFPWLPPPDLTEVP